MEEILTKKQRRALRKEQLRTEQRMRVRRKRTTRFSVITAGIIFIIGIGWFFGSKVNVNTSPGRRVDTLGNLHISHIGAEHIAYNTKPPTSGPHIGSIAPWGISHEPIPDERQVHNLEDGGVGVQYNCQEECDELIAELTSLVNDYKSEVFMAPYPDMESKIALTSWGRIDTLEEFDEERIRRFIEAYRGIDHHVQTGSSNF